MAIKTFAISMILTGVMASDLYAFTPEDDYSQQLQNLRNFCPPSLGIDNNYSPTKCSATIKESLKWANSAAGSKLLIAIPTYRDMLQKAVNKARKNLRQSVIH
jgi:hypothetical protein